jgi:hypothetical protein
MTTNPTGKPVKKPSVKKVPTKKVPAPKPQSVSPLIPGFGLTRKPGYETMSGKKGLSIKKKMKNGGSLSGLTASTKRDKGVDPKGAFTKVQKKALAGAKGKASLTKDKQLGATKMKMGGKMKKC